MDEYTFPCDPVANPKSILQGQQFRFTLITPVVLRYEWAEDGVFEDRASTFCINRGFPSPEYYVRSTDDQLEIITPSFQVSYDKRRFSPNGLTVSFNSKVSQWGTEWRYGTPPSRHNLGGTARTLDEVNGRCDMGSGILSKEGYADIDDSKSILFDGSGFVAPRRAGDRIDGYLFIYGLDFKAGMKAFYAISGKQPIIPRWTLGNWWSRYHEYTGEGYIELMDRFKAENIPMSVAVLDMDWHWVHEDWVPHAGWTGYSWNTSLFPDPVAFAKALHDRGLKMTLNDHPHAGIHHHEDDYEAVAKAIGHNTSKKEPILFDPTSPVFMNAYLNVLHRNLERKGCDFWWIDWQQGPFSKVPGMDPLWLLNHFHFVDQTIHSPHGGLPIIFSRYAGPGSHRYPIGFSGDTIISWESLAFQPEFTATASNIGFGWWSHDLGGHMHGGRDDELTARWVQLGTFSPVLRLHSSNSPWTGKEPWKYRRDAKETMAESMRLRHRLVPYIYSESYRPDEPLCQPMYWSHAYRAQAYQYPNQYTFGASLVAAPIVQPRDPRTELAQTRVWVPPGRHVDMFNGMVYDGDRQMEMYRPLSSMPLLAPEGSIIPLDGDLVPKNGCKNPESLEVLVVVGRDGRFKMIEEKRDDAVTQDEDQGQREFDIHWDQIRGRLSVNNVVRRRWTFRFVSVLEHTSEMKVLLDQSPALKVVPIVEASSCRGPPGLVFVLPEVEVGRAISIELGADPQLSVMDYTEKLRDLVSDFQLPLASKDEIWRIIESQSTMGIKAGELFDSGLEKAFFGPVIECLTCDSRAQPCHQNHLPN